VFFFGKEWRLIIIIDPTNILIGFFSPPAVWGRGIVKIRYLLVRWERPYLMERSERERERERDK
jgi:hypothetical protein